MTDTPTARPPLTTADIEAHQDAKGSRKYPTRLEDAGLSVGALALHALEESVDRRRYLRAAGLWTAVDVVQFAFDEARLLPIADHPKPLPPDVPTAEAVAAYGPWWQLGEDVVQVEFGENGIGRFWQVGDAFHDSIDPAGPWLGPVQLRPNPQEKS